MTYPNIVVFMRNRKFLFIFIILLAFILRFPFVKAGLPYFQNEDEMHHFNRTIKMMQEGTFNPEYFLKPSFHFYLRIPVTATAFIWNVKKGNIQKLSDIKISNNYGLSNYSSIASHPGIVKWNRMFSLILSVLTLILIFFIIKELTHNYYTAIIGTGLFTLAPPQIELSTQINVDIPVMFFCTLTTFVAIKTYNKFTLGNLILLSVLSGLAISTKYNAAPIYFLPIFTIYISKKLSVKHIFISLLVPIFAFFLASPFAFINYNLFLNHLAYEVKHYGVDGHVGHMQNPGFGQLWHYTKWFCTKAIGFIPFLLCLYGIYVSIIKNFKQEIFKSSINKHLITLFFPFLFILLMIFQKANFERNMLMALPFLCIFASIGLIKTLEFITRKNENNTLLLKIIISLFIFLFFIQPLFQTLISEKKVLSIKDTRSDVSAWVRKNNSLNYNIFTSGQLELEPDIFKYTNIGRIDEKTPFSTLYNKGGNYVILPKYIKNNEQRLYKKILSFKGQKKDPNNRLYLNPNIIIYKQIPITDLDISKLKEIANETPTNFKVIQNKNYNKLYCDTNDNQECWLTSKINKISVKNIATSEKILKISYLSPWENQKVWIVLNDTLKEISCDNLEPWNGICEKEITLPKDKIRSGYIYIIIDKLISPKLAHFSSDERLLGIIIK